MSRISVAFQILFRTFLDVKQLFRCRKWLYFLGLRLCLKFLQKALRGGIPLTEQSRLSPEVKAHCEDLISQQYEWVPEK